MGQINILDKNISNLIAAGEVVEGPASVVKELMENSIDAGASSITIEIKNGGKSYIRVTDNGHGINKKDVVTAFKRHATSKITKEDDLKNIETLGFRGEALASISSVSLIELVTKTPKSKEGISVIIKANKLIEEKEIGCPEGTSIIVKHLFFNTPARMKFLKRDATETGYISDIINRMILGHPEISFRFINNSKEVIYTIGDNKLINCIYSLYGKSYSQSMLQVKHSQEGIQVSGLIGKPNISRANRNLQSFFINGRYVKSTLLTYAVQEAYKNILTTNKFPVTVLHINIKASLIDINVHPTKMEVKFSDEKQIYNTIYWSVKNALYSEKDIPEISAINKSKQRLQEEDIKENLIAEDPIIKERKNPPEKTIAIKNTKEIQQENKSLLDEEYKIIGRIFNTYIIVEKSENILLIDQHAAHERLNYEKLLANYKNYKINSQILLIPEVVVLSDIEMASLIENKTFFKNVGFKIEDFGNNSVIIREVPIGIAQEKIKTLFLEIIDIIEKHKPDDLTHMEERALYSIACKASIKANEGMHIKEIQQLIKDLLKLENINTCPHGRPITISLTKKQIEKEFKRI